MALERKKMVEVRYLSGKNRRWPNHRRLGRAGCRRPPEFNLPNQNAQIVEHA
jgi:hypothetical protein